MKKLMLLMVALLVQVGSSAAQGSSTGCAMGRGGGAGVTDGCYGGASVDIEVDSPLHGTYRVQVTDSTGQTGWLTATPNPNGGVSDSQTGRTSDGGDPPSYGGTYRVKNNTVQKKNSAGDWVDLARRKKPTGDELDALESAFDGAGGRVVWVSVSQTPRQASPDGAAWSDLYVRPGQATGEQPFALAHHPWSGWFFMSPGDVLDSEIRLTVVSPDIGEGSGTLPRYAFWTNVN